MGAHGKTVDPLSICSEDNTYPAPPYELKKFLPVTAYPILDCMWEEQITFKKKK